MVEVKTKPVIKINVITVVARVFGLYGRRCGPDYQGIRTTDGKLHGIVICENHHAVLKSDSLEPQFCTIRVNNNNNNNSGIFCCYRFTLRAK